jgi:hypothetical protein
MLVNCGGCSLGTVCRPSKAQGLSRTYGPSQRRHPQTPDVYIGSAMATKQHRATCASWSPRQVWSTRCSSSIDRCRLMTCMCLHQQDRSLSLPTVTSLNRPGIARMAYGVPHGEQTWIPPDRTGVAQQQARLKWCIDMCAILSAAAAPVRPLR